MISNIPPTEGMQADFGLACTTAYMDAEAFRTHYLSGTIRDFFDRRPMNIYRAVSDLILFCADYAELEVQTFAALPRPNFASWLMKLSSTRAGIALAISQMRQWEWMPDAQTVFQSRGIPLPTQKIRSLIHEVGHHHISDLCGLRRTTPEEEVGLSRSADGREEELAWVYTFVFLSILLGDYSFLSRQGQPELDDVPKIFV